MSNILIPKGRCKYNQVHLLDDQMLSKSRGVAVSHKGKEYRLLFPPETMICTSCLERLCEEFIVRYIA